MLKHATLLELFQTSIEQSQNVKTCHTVGTVPNSIRTIVECQNIPHCWNCSKLHQNNRRMSKHATLLELFQTPLEQSQNVKTYHTVGTVPNFIITIVECQSTPHCWNCSKLHQNNRRMSKHATLLELFQTPLEQSQNVKAHHTVGTVPNSIRTIVECQN